MVTKNGRSCACSDRSPKRSVIKEFDEWIEKLRITNNVGIMKKTGLLGTTRILRKLLEM